MDAAAIVNDDSKSAVLVFGLFAIAAASFQIAR